MKEHNGMRPQDIVVLLKIAALGTRPWRGKDLASALGISASEVSESLNRSAIAELLEPDRKSLMQGALLEFLEFGLKYTFPVVPGSLVRGVPTAHSAPPLAAMVAADEPFVWPGSSGSVRGQAIKPLHPGVVNAVQQDAQLYELLALADALRVGRARERSLAIKELRARIQR
ncbi:MAG: hypothetical protein ABIF71_13445 [Planctomycetota bacterium]